MSITPATTPPVYCDEHDEITVVAPATESYLSGVYTIAHKSSVGVKYVNVENNIKITYSSRVNNIVGGHWRWANNVSPYTLYYANASKESCIPKTGWQSISQDVFVGSLDNNQDTTYDVYQPCKVYDMYKKCESYDVYHRCHPVATPVVTVTIPEATPLPTPTSTQTPVYMSIPAPPPGILRNSLTEHVWVRAKPTISYSTTLSISTQYTPRKVRLYGLSLSYTDRVYVTGDQSLFGSALQMIDMFTHVPSLSADFPGFYGIQVDYISHDDNVIVVYIPGLIAPGELDIIIMNRAGYSGMNPGYSDTQWTDYNLQNRLINVS